MARGARRPNAWMLHDAGALPHAFRPGLPHRHTQRSRQPAHCIPDATARRRGLLFARSDPPHARRSERDDGVSDDRGAQRAQTARRLGGQPQFLDVLVALILAIGSRRVKAGWAGGAAWLARSLQREVSSALGVAILSLPVVAGFPRCRLRYPRG